MDAVISGRAGTAILFGGDSLKSFGADDPTSLVPRCPSDLRLLFGDAVDIEPLQDITHEIVSQKLKSARDFAASIDLALILFDADLSKRVREEAASVLETLLDDSTVIDRLESILYGQPLPGTADLEGAFKVCGPHLARVYLLLKRLQHHQPLIRECRLAWDSLPPHLFSGEEQQSEFHHTAITEGLFRDLAKAAGDTSSFISTYESINDARALSNYESVVRCWINSIESLDKRRLPISQSLIRKNVIERELVIIGGGVAGLLTAIMALERGIKDVVVFEALESKTHDSQLLRNHAWLQSGLFLARRNPLGNLSIRDLSVNLLTRLGFLTSTEEWRSSVSSTASFGGTHYTTHLENLASSITRAEPPDSSPDITESISELVPAAKKLGVDFQRVKVELVLEPNSPSGFLIATGNQLIEPKFALFGASEQQDSLFSQLGISQYSGLQGVFSPHYLSSGLLMPTSLGSRSEETMFDLHSLESSPYHSMTSLAYIAYGPLIATKDRSHESISRNLLAHRGFSIAPSQRFALGLREQASEEMLGWSRTVLHQHFRTIELSGSRTFGSFHGAPWDLQTDIINHLRSSDLLIAFKDKETFYTRFLRDKSSILRGYGKAKDLDVKGGWARFRWNRRKR